MKKYWDAWASGVGIGMVIYIVMLLLSQVKTQTVEQILVVVMASGLMGFASLIYYIEHWSFLKRAVVHLGLVFCLVLGMVLKNEWLDLSSAASKGYLWFALLFLVEFLLIYGIIWYIFYKMQSKRVKRINQHLQEKSCKCHS